MGGGRGRQAAGGVEWCGRWEGEAGSRWGGGVREVGRRGRQAAAAPAKLVRGVAGCVWRGLGRARQVQENGTGGSCLTLVKLQTRQLCRGMRPGNAMLYAALRVGALPTDRGKASVSYLPPCICHMPPNAPRPCGPGLTPLPAPCNSQMRENAERRRTVPMTDLERTINAKALDKVSTWQSTGRLPELSYSTHV